MKLGRHVRRLTLSVAVALAATIGGGGQMPAQAGPYDDGNYPYYLNPYGESYGADCGTVYDTPPAQSLDNDYVCYASLSSESSTQLCGGWACDEFTVTPGLDDAVVVHFGSYCRTNYWYPWRPTDSGYAFQESGTQGNGFFTARTAGAHKVIVQVGLDYDNNGYHVCSGGGSYGGQVKSPYTIYAEVVPNTRPVVSVAAGPARVLVGEPAVFQLTGTDVDANLSAFGARATSSGGETWVDAATGDSAGVRLHEAQDVRLLARDSWGVDSDPVLRRVEVYEDDCGTGADIATLALVLGTPCTAYLAKSLGDESDTFTVDVPADPARLAVGLGLSPMLQARVKATSPSGAVFSGLTEGSTLASQPGTWTFEVARSAGWGIDTSAGGYTFQIVGLGDPVAPVVSASISPGSVVAGQWTSLSATATDPNGRNISYTVDWADGTTSRYPASGTVPSGVPATFSHVYKTAGAYAPVVRATNLDNLTTAKTLAVTVALGSDSCAGGATSLTDAPGSTSSWSSAQSASYERAAPAACTGWISVYRSDGSIDTNDIVRFRTSVLKGTALDLTIRAGSTDQLRWRVAALGRNATVAVFSDEWHRVGPGGSDTIRAPLPIDVEFVYVEVSGAPSSVSWNLTATPSAI